MDFRRVRAWDWASAIAGVVLLVALFLPWYGDDTAWEAFAATDIVLAFAGLAAIAYAVVCAAQRTAAVPQTYAAALLPLAGIAALLVLIRLLNAPDVADTGRAIGVWIAAAAALALFAASYRSMADRRFPTAMRPNLEIATIPTPAPDGERRDLA